ncbi:sugar ABC transporter substrate-binding protein [Chelatococcus sp.]|nr:sugar ABC transporter substrate-binding protein [Chelatococcus sp.]MBX3556280.1 sugar ABC transporter substrate-binding protein [Chelatococcus sp.]
MKYLTRRVLVAAAFVLAAGPAAAQQKTITWITHPVIYDVTGKGELLKKFTEETGIKVEVTTFPTDALAQRIPAEFIAGSDAYDVVTMANFWSERLTRYVEPLEPYLAKKPVSGGIEAFSEGFVRQFRIPLTPEGKLYAIPLRMSVDILFYRKDILEQAGVAVPKTLDEYYAAAKKLTKDTDGDGKTDIYGAVYQGIQSNQGLYDWYDWAAPLGVDILTSDGKKAAFNTPQAVKATEMRRRFVAEGLVNPGVLSYSFDDAISAMAQGKAAMSIMFDAYWSQLENKEKSQVAGKIGYAAAPRDPSVSDAYFGRGWGLFINGKSKNKDAAWEFISWLTAPEQQLWMAVNHGNPISRPAVAAHPDFVAKVPVAPALTEALPRARTMPVSAEFVRVQDILVKHISAAQAGTVSARDALAAAEREVAPILK